MTTLLAESTGHLSVAIADHRLDELAFQTAAEIVGHKETLIVVDAAGCFDPNRMTHSARIGAIDPAGLMRYLHILRARSVEDLETIILYNLEAAFDKFGTRHVLIPDLLGVLYDPGISTRDAARLLGRLKCKLEALASTGAQIVLLCRDTPVNLGTKAHFRSSLCASAHRVYLRSNT